MRSSSPGPPIAAWLHCPGSSCQYLRQCDQEAEAIRRTIEATQRSGPTKEELLARAEARGLNP